MCTVGEAGFQIFSPSEASCHLRGCLITFLGLCFRPVVIVKCSVFILNVFHSELVPFVSPVRIDGLEIILCWGVSDCELLISRINHSAI